MLLEVKGDLPCYSDTLRVNKGSWRTDIVLISLFGPRNSVRAAWASLSKTTGRKGFRGSITVGDTSLYLETGTSYSSVTSPLEKGLLHCVMFHPMLSHNAPDCGYIYQTGPDAPRRYFDRLARWCPIPFRVSWRSSLWGIGRERGAIVELPGHGRDVWHISTKRDVWAPIVQDALISGELS